YMRLGGTGADTATHWDWAIRQAMERSRATHFTVHYDRKITRPHHLQYAQSVARQWPEMVVTWPHDYVTDVPPPLRLWQPPWTGNVYGIRSARVVQIVSQGRAGTIPSHALPLLSNTLVPRSVLEDVLSRFGEVCMSTTPDSCFAFRLFTIRERYLHLDRPLGIIYAPHRSANAGYLRGGGTDFDAFRETWGDRAWLDAAPIPGLTLGMNMLYHEYERVRRATGEQLPPIDYAGYLNDLAAGLPLVRDRKQRAALRRELERHGWRGRGRRGRLRFIVRHRVLGALDQHLGVRVPGVQGRVVENDEEALALALQHPRPRQTSERHLALLQPVQVGMT
ncbi:MAG: hypothetical protein M3Q69_20705, partial [Acidobacteriota bacterium]|nr:hypothetical protein [Acidobacteriota bacterium]